MDSKKPAAENASFRDITAAVDGGVPDGGRSIKASSCAAYYEGNDDAERRTVSQPGTPEHRWAPWKQRGAPRDCASESELKSGVCRRRRWVRERKLDRAWQRRSRASVSDSFSGGSGGGGRESCECRVVVRPRQGCGAMICMDMEEVRACRDLGLEIPRDFTVEIPGGLSGNTSAVDSPNSAAGEDADEIKAKLKLWAHAVAFVSSAARSGR